MKIAKIINTCNDCQHCTFASTSKSVYHFAICTENEENNFILFNSSEMPSRYNIHIPDNCPLEDYKGTQTLEKDE